MSQREGSLSNEEPFSHSERVGRSGRCDLVTAGTVSPSLGREGEEWLLMLNILVYTLAMIGVTATLALAEVMVCTQDNGRICTLAQSGKGGEGAVVVVGARVGDRLVCTLEEGTVVCTKATRK